MLSYGKKQREGEREREKGTNREKERALIKGIKMSQAYKKGKEREKGWDREKEGRKKSTIEKGCKGRNIGNEKFK